MCDIQCNAMQYNIVNKIRNCVYCKIVWEFMDPVVFVVVLIVLVVLVVLVSVMIVPV